MRTYIALFRGINVGGAGILPMSELRALLEELGAEGVKTYIQSGNAVFRAAEDDAGALADRIRAAILDRFGFEPRVLVLEPGTLERVLAANPFPGAEAVPNTLHLYFLESVPVEPGLERIESARSESERYLLDGSVFYLHAPDGIGRSRLAAAVEKALGVRATARNWRSLTAILSLARETG